MLIHYTPIHYILIHCIPIAAVCAGRADGVGADVEGAGVERTLRAEKVHRRAGEGPSVGSEAGAGVVNLQLTPHTHPPSPLSPHPLPQHKTHTTHQVQGWWRKILAAKAVQAEVRAAWSKLWDDDALEWYCDSVYC
jgi:hypothetical protein